MSLHGPGAGDQDQPDAHGCSLLRTYSKRPSTNAQLIVEHIDPWEAFQTIAHIEVIPFRDAGNGPNEYALSIQVSSGGHAYLLTPGRSLWNVEGVSEQAAYAAGV